MKAKRFVFTRDRLMILFNGLTDLGYDKNIRFSVPLLNDLILFKASFSGDGVRVSDFIGPSEFNDRAHSLTKRMKPAGKREIPDFGHLRQALFQAGIAKPEGLDQLEETMAMIERQNIIQGGDVYHIGLDTNLLRDRFFSVYLRHRWPRRNLDFILCETVRHELKNRKEKFGRSDFKGMGPIDFELLDDCFMNQNRLEDRLRYIGFLEYNRMRAATACPEIDAPSARSGSRNDQIILEAYSDFVKVGRKVIFISRDHEVVRMMRGEDNVIPILLEQGRFQESEFTAAWPGFLNLLFLLGVLFGQLRVVVGGVEIGAIFGVWKGKDLREWETDSVRLELYKPRGGEPEEIREFEFLNRLLDRGLSALEALSA